ncbi:MAG: transglutaminase-like domain-containing protein [Candidatus Micrarchaeota archaeon]
MKGKLVVLVVILQLFVTFAAVTEITEPALVNRLDSEVVEAGQVSAIGGEMTNLRLNVSIPRLTEYQNVEYRGQGALVKDENGNSFASITEESPQNPYSYSASAKVRTIARATAELPSSFVVPYELDRYAQPSQNIQSDSEEIRSLARQITANSRDDFERVARLAVWVYDNLGYDESVVGEEKDALWALQNKRGVCVEYSALFVALARSVNIPARLVSGYAYNSENGWMGHRWAEAYVGKWVPVDPTWLEVGNLDATHIELYISSGEVLGSEASASVTEGARLEFTRESASGKKVEAVKVTDVRAVLPKKDFAFDASAGRLNFGEKTMLYAKIRSDDYRVVELNLQPCSGESIFDSFQNEQKVIMRPDEERFVVWVARAGSSGSKDYVYTCPFTLNSVLFEDRSKEITVTPERIDKVGFDAWLGSSSITLGDNQTIFYKPSSISQTARIGFVSDYEEGSAPAKSVLTQQFSFRPRQAGRNTVYVYSTTGGVEELEFDVSAGNKTVYVKNFSAQTSVPEGARVEVNVTVANTGSAAESVSVGVELDGEGSVQRATVVGEQNFTFSLLAKGAGETALVVTLQADGEVEKKAASVSVIEGPLISIDNVGFEYEEGEAIVVVTLSKRGEPKNAEGMVGGRRTPITFPQTKFGLLPGGYELKITWGDDFGNSFTTSQMITVPAEKKEGVGGIDLGSIKLPCISGVLVLALLLFVIKSRSK